MDKRSILLVVILFMLIVVGMFTFAFLKRSEEISVVIPEPKINYVPYADISRIEAKHFYIDGVHTFAGEITMPTPCDLVEVTAEVLESQPEQVSLFFTVINNADMCAQVITSQRFAIEVSASSEASVTAQFMGRPVILNLIPALPGETPADFELFIKG
jgi:hypothetical protein